MPGYGSVATSIDRSRSGAATWSPVRPAISTGAHVQSHVSKAFKQHCHVVRPDTQHIEFTVRHGSGGKIGSRLYAVRHSVMTDRIQLVAFDTLDNQRRCTNA